MRSTTLLLFLCAAGCDGFISAGWASDPIDVDPEPGGTEALANVGAPLDTPLRRLTRTEYLNSIRDVLYLDDTSAIVAAYPDDQASEGFDNDTDGLTVDELAVERYDGLVTAAVAQAFAAGTASRSRLVTCAVSASCYRDVVDTFARRAWRRPVTGDELDGLMTSFAEAAQLGDTAEDGLQLAARRALISAHFLYRVEVDPLRVSRVHRVSPHELAVRLSYFLWSTIPDPELMTLADDGTLSDETVFAAQVARMLADPKADALVDNFGAQWLQTRTLSIPGIVTPDPVAFPVFDDGLRSALVAESRLFFGTFMRGERGVPDMLDADFTFADERLAAWYGLPPVSGPGLSRVSLAGTPRLGLLSQGSVLTLTSTPTRTSPTRRGKWVLSRLLCAPPAPPPANVGALDEHPANLPADATIRELMASHQQKGSSCAGCHTVMDPIGFSMEHYDGIGRWRAAYPTRPIDATAKVGGVDIDGAADLARVLKADKRVVHCATENVYAYALGREPRSREDFAAVEKLNAGFVERGARLDALISLVAMSRPFQLRRGER